MEVVKDVYSYTPWRAMPQCSDEWGPDVLQSEPESQYYIRFCVSGLWYFVWEEFSPSIFLHCLPFSSALLWSRIWWGLNSEFMIPLWELATASTSSSWSHPPSLLSPTPLAPCQQSCPICSWILPFVSSFSPSKPGGDTNVMSFETLFQILSLTTRKFCITSVTSLCSASPFCWCFSASSLWCVTGDSGHLSMRLMTPTSYATPQTPLIHKLPPSLTKHAPFTPLPVWTSKTLGDDFGQGATLSHLRGKMENLCWKIHSPCCMY